MILAYKGKKLPTTNAKKLIAAKAFGVWVAEEDEKEFYSLVSINPTTGDGLWRIFGLRGNGCYWDSQYQGSLITNRVALLICPLSLATVLNDVRTEVERRMTSDDFFPACMALTNGEYRKIMDEIESDDFKENWRK